MEAQREQAASGAAQGDNKEEEEEEAGGEEEGESIGDYFQYRFDQMKDTSGAIPNGAQMKALTQRATMVRQQANSLRPHVAGIDNLSWTYSGPGNIGGRIRAVLPINASTVFVGGVSGGIWKTTNCCSTSTTWTPINDFMANLAVSSLILDPTNANVMYAGTGEGFFNVDAVRGAGVFKSTDGGATWNQLASTNNSSWYFVNRLAISSNGATLLAATNTGIYRSTDAGSTWTQVESSSNYKDVKFDPTDSMKAIASRASFQVRYSTDGGATWQVATGVTSGTSSLDRVELAYAPSNPSVVYASAGPAAVVYKSTDGGHTYSLVNADAGYQASSSSQYWYDNTLWVNPTDPNHVVGGGLDLYQSTNGGTTWTKISDWTKGWPDSPPSPHADHHALVSIPGSSTALLNGNDGGIMYTSNILTAGNNPPGYNNGWVYLNNNLGITQFYGVSGNGNGVLYGGAQDNGVSRGTPGAPNAWTYAFGGDGGKAVIDPTNPNYLYSEYTNAQVHRSSNGGSSADYIYGTYYNGSAWVCRAAPYRIDDACNGSANFIAPILLDPNNANRLLVGGLSLWVTNDARTPFVYNSPTGGPQWAAIKPSIGSNIISIAVAPSSSNVIWVGYANSRIDRTTDGGATWTRVDTNIGVNKPGTQVSAIAIDRNNSNIVYVGFTGFGANRAWRTADGGATWTNITSNLPQAPIYAFAINPSNSAWLYVGTEIGIFASVDTGATWNVPAGVANGDGPANVATFDLQWMGGGNSTGSTILVAGTHGRSAWTVDVSPSANVNTYADPGLVCGGNSPCYATIGEAMTNVATGGTVTIYAGTYLESVTTANRTVTVNVVGNITINDLSLYNGTTWNGGSYAITVNNFNLFGGIWNAGSSTLTVNGTWTGGGTFNADTGTSVFAKNGVVTANVPAQTEGTFSFCNLAINANTTVDTTDDFISAATGGACTQFTQNGKLRRETPQQTVINLGPFTFKDARNRDSVILQKQSGNSLFYTNITITSNQQPPATCGVNPFPTTPVLRQFDITSSGGTAPYGPYRMRLYFSASSPNEANGNTVVPPYTLAIYHCNGTSWEKYAGTGGSDANGVYVESSVATWSTGSTFAIGASGAAVYYSQGSLDAGALASWNTSRGGGGSAPANFNGPDYFVIQNGHSMTTATAFTLSNTDSLLQIESGGAMTVNTNDVSVMGAQIDSGGTLTINSSRTLTINNGSRAPDMTVNGTLVNAGTVTMTGTGSFGAGSVYQHAQNGGTIPTETWNAASTVSITAIAATAPGGLGQTFGNVIWNSSGQSGNLSLSGNLYNVVGNLTVTSTGSGSVRLANTLASGTVNVGGNVLVNGGTLYVSGSTGALTLNVGGNVTVGSGNFYFSGGTATPTVNVTGNVTLNGGLLQPSLSTGVSTLNVAGNWTNNGSFTAGIGTATFNGAAPQTIGGSAITTFNNLTINNTGAGVSLGQNQTVNSLLTLTNGDVDLGGNTLTLATTTAGHGVTATGARAIIGSGTVAFTAARAISGGTLAFGPNVIVRITDGVDFGAGGLSTINGILLINGGGYVQPGKAPTYGSSSTLKYDTSGTYGAYEEWYPNTTSGPGVPQNVEIAAGTALNFGSSAFARTARGDVTINGSLTLSTAGGGDLKLGGNWVNNGTLNANGRAVEFNGAAAQTIGGSVDTTFAYLTINNTSADSAGVSLGRNTVVNNQLTLTDGLLKVAAYNLTLGANASISHPGSAVSMVVTDVDGAATDDGFLCKAYSGNGSFQFPVGDAYGATEYSPSTLNFTADLGASTVCVRVTNARHPNWPGTNYPTYITRYWTATSSDNSFTCTASFTYVDGDVVLGGTPQQTEAALYHTVWDGASWTTRNQANVDTNTLSSAVNSFSDHSAFSGSPLAVTLAAFDAQATADGVMLAWETVSELDNAGFNVYRTGSDTGPWSKLNDALIPAATPGAGTGQAYTWADVSAQPNTAYLYRLEAVDLAGNAEILGITGVTYRPAQRRWLPLVR